MPIDPTMKDAMLGTFKNMVQECKDKNYSGENFDIMIETYNRMEELAETNDDLNAFNGQVMKENLFGKFSEYYSKVLSNAASQNQKGDSGDYDDKAMLNQTLDGLRSTIQSIRDAKKAALNETKSYDPKKAEQRIELYDALAEKSSFTIPNPKELAYENQKLDRKHQPDITLWKEIEDRREDLLWQLSFWSLSYCKFAPNIKPWSMAIDPQKAVIETQDIKPGIFKEKEKLFKKYFNISFLDIFNHPSFEWKVKHFTIDYSQEYVEFLIKKVYPECKPFNHLPKDIISEKETNPETHFILDNFKKFYDEKFGEGRFESKFPTPEYPECKAAIWNFDDFKQHL